MTIFSASPVYFVAPSGRVCPSVLDCMQLCIFTAVSASSYAVVCEASVANASSAIWQQLHKTRQAIYVQRNIEARSRNHICCGNAISIIYWSVCACLRVRVCM
jgi:hypothetical protein